MSELFRDPIHDGATDPVIVRAAPTGCGGSCTPAGGPMPQRGRAWRGCTERHRLRRRRRRWRDVGVSRVARRAGARDGAEKLWAPEVVWAEGRVHRYVSYIRGVPDRWAGL